MIRIVHKKDCCGCTACVSVCAHHCITMHEDAEGFKYPQVDTAACVDCGLCEKVCPILHPESDKNILQVIAAKNKDEVVRKESSSGGVFSILAEAFIEDGGVVVGCAMNKELQAVHVFCETKEELIRLRSSKYVQSDIEGIFPQVRQLLRDGRKVLFSGTPCQVAGLRKFLMKQFDNLFCIDLLCHGVPSPKLFRDYKEMMEKNYDSKAVSVNFRCKRKEWKRLYIELKFANGKEYFKSATFDPYMQLFLGNQSQRSSCFHCPFTSPHRQGDISLGDFWGMGRTLPKFDDDKGISMILINTDKGLELYRHIEDDMISFNTNFEQAVSGNQVLAENILGEDRRNLFYADYVENGLFYAMKKHTQHYSQYKQVFVNIMRWGLDLVRKIFHKGY